MTITSPRDRIEIMLNSMDDILSDAAVYYGEASAVLAEDIEAALQDVKTELESAVQSLEEADCDERVIAYRGRRS